MDEDVTVESPEKNMDDAWRYVLSQSDSSSRAWLKNTKPLTVHETTMVVAVPNDFTRERIETRLRHTLEEILSDFYTRTMHVALTIETDLELNLYPPAVEEDSYIPSVTPEVAVSHTPHDLHLNAGYTFDNFVIGSSNRFAHAAAAAVAESPGKAYNPLMIYGQSGLGKTHLLHAIGHYVNEYFSELTVKYVTTEDMTNEFINAVASGSMNDFRRSYREVDVLLIDDIQFLSSKTQTQEEFFHTFNTLHNAQKQIVVTSDRPPKAIEALEDRLRSRFEWGLITDIQPPDFETRIAILRRIIERQGSDIDDSVLEFIASHIHSDSNIRELEGALVRVSAFSSLNDQKPSIDVAKHVLSDLLSSSSSGVLTPRAIMEVVGQYYGVTVDDMMSSSRVQKLVNARQIAMYLSRELTEFSLPKIAGEFGGRDHTTVMYADRKIQKLMKTNMAVYNQVSEITALIKKNR